MRLNRLDKNKKGSRGWTKVAEDGRPNPKYVSPETTIGRVSSDVIATVFAPRIKEKAWESLEKYANDMMIYDDLMKAYEEENRIIEDESTEESPEVEEMETEADGTVRRTTNENAGPPPEAPLKPLFHSQYMIDELLGTVTEISNHFSEKGGWKVHARAAKFERDLDEKYGIFRPFVTNYPEIEVFVRSMQRKYEMGYFSPLRTGAPPIPKTTSIIILFMMQRNGVRWDAMILSALFFLIGLQPWALVTIVAVFQQLLNRRTRKPIGTMPKVVESVEPYWRASSSNEDNDNSEESEKKAKRDLLLKPVGKELGNDEKIDGSAYDTILIGSGPDTLYAGALLARAGRKILVLSPGSDASGCLVLEGAGEKYKAVPFDAESSNISRISRQQELLAPALCTSTDYQGGVRFAQVGSDADGYAFEILSIPGMGADDPEGHIPFVLRSAGGNRAIMDDTAALLGDGWPATDGSVGGSTSGLYMAACAGINASAGAFYLSKILPEASKSLQGQSNYEESSCRYAEAFLNKCFPLNPHLRSLMAGIGMKGENLKPNNTSMGAHVTNICAATGGEGMYYPVGGPRSLCHALATAIEQRGGRIVTKVPIKELLFENTVPANTTATGNKPGEAVPPRCLGVKLFDDQEIKLPAPAGGKGGDTKTAVINMKGFIDTFVRLLPENIRTAHKVPMGLPALAERRPLFKILFAFKGSADELSVTGADYYRLPAAARARDQIDPETGAITLGEIGWSDEVTPPQAETAGESSEVVSTEDINVDPANESEEKSEDAGQGGVRGKRSKTPTQTKVPAKSKFDAGVSWLKISFPSAKDPSWEERHGKVTTCVVTIEADDDFVVRYDTKPKLYSIVPAKVSDSGNRGRLMDRVKRDLVELYPQLEGTLQ